MARQSKTPQTRAPGRGRTFLRRLIAWLFLWGLVVGVVGVLVLDVFVRAKFDGAKWALPAHVYGRSLDIYQGLGMSMPRLRWELDALGYRAVPKVSGPGQYRSQGNLMEIYTRAFPFWDGNEPGQRVLLSFDGATVSRLRGTQGDLDLVRLEPMLIGGIYPDHAEDRVLVKLDELPRELVGGLLAVEDRRFFEHHGISFIGITRAFFSNLVAGGTVQGGSTITQQLVKNFYLTQERSLIRKGMEAVMAVLLELHFDKKEILEAYINEVYLGQSGKRAIHGFGLASRHYFRQPIGELDTHQLALLIGMVKGASYYEPWRNPERATQRRNLVIDEMAEHNVITAEAAEAAKRRPLDLASKPGTSTNPYPAYLQMVKEQLYRDYREEDLKTAGLRIFTHFDPQVQRQVQSSVTDVIAGLEKGYKISAGALETAVVMVRIGTADVLALAGGRDPGYAGYNRAIDARRQVGSTIKPAVYLAALEQPSRYTLGTLVDDSPVAINDGTGKLWRPQNYDKRSYGQIPLYRALANSYNQSTARIGMGVGLPAVSETIRRLGYEGPLKQLPSMLLGTMDMSPMDVAGMYHTIAAEGFYTPLRAISAVYTADNRQLKSYPFSTEQRFRPQVMHLLHYGLQAAMKEGTGEGAYRRLPAGLAVAGKTGTTNDQRDSWFAGFSGDYVGVVWIGRDDNAKMPLTGASGALKVWADIMAGLDTKSISFIKPEGVTYHWVETATQSLSSEGCPGVRSLPYLGGSEPRQHSSCFRGQMQGVFDQARDVMGRFKEMFGQ